MMKRHVSGRRRASLVACVALLACAVSTATVYARAFMSNGFRAKTARPVRLAILPPHAEFIKDKMIMTDQMVAEAAALELNAGASLKAQLEIKGYQVRIITPQDIARVPGLQATVRKVNGRFEEEWSKMVYRPKKIREHRYTLDREAVKLCAMLRADGVVIARVQAVGVSKGKATMRAIFGSNAPHSYARIDFSVVEGKQGFIEGYFIGYENTSLSQLTKKPARVMEQATGNALKRYPAKDEALEVRDVAVEASSDDEGGTDPVGDFEALLKKGSAQGQK